MNIYIYIYIYLGCQVPHSLLRTRGYVGLEELEEPYREFRDFRGLRGFEGGLWGGLLGAFWGLVDAFRGVWGLLVLRTFSYGI